jgi:hypothetical protein
MKFNIVISTQIHENYGAHDWDGKGECPQYWKAKGGEEYRHPVTLELNEVQDAVKLGLLVRELANSVSVSGNSFREEVRDWYLLPVGQLTDSEKEQVEWYDSVKYPVKAPAILQKAYAA